MKLNSVNILFLFLFNLTITLNAQFNQQDFQSLNGNASNAVSAFLGPNVQFNNAAFIGDGQQIARFSNGLDKVGIDNGIMLSSSTFTYATLENDDIEIGGNHPTSKPSNSVDLVDDPFINGQIKDYASLSFEFVSTSELLQFEFVFASAEYPFFVYSNFNDKFVFILTEFNELGAVVSESNIALLPSNNDVISINTVNNGSSDPQFSDLPPANPEYFIQSNNDWVFRGRTTVIPIAKSIKCGTRYKLRISICDIRDQIRDSAVFLKSSSWYNNNVSEILIPNGSFCDGEEVSVSISGPSNSLYEWSNGQSGVNLNSIQINANADNPDISVTVSPPNLENCPFVKSASLIVHTANNIAPYMNGINNTGIYDVYVRALDLIEFQVPTFDSENENVSFEWLPPAIGVQEVNFFLPKDVGKFSWIPDFAAMGIYEIFAKCNDNNVCESLSSPVYQFKIHVVCPYCEISVDYANRSPQSNPLPPLTEAAATITAGINGPVEVGNDQVIFRAPTIILDAVGFETGPQFIAENESVCTETVCDKCCESEYNTPPELLISNTFTPNGDGINDIWHIVDLANPFCAFNSKSTELNIYDRWGNDLVFRRSVNSEQCCAFKSPPAPYADILNPLSWNGTYNVNSWQNPPIGTLVDNDTYFYTYKIVTCSETLEGAGYITVVAGSARFAFQGGGNSIEENHYSNSNQKFEFLIYPNPSKDIFNVKLLNIFNVKLLNIFNEKEDYKLVVNDVTGRALSILYVKNEVTELDLSNLANGYYLISLLDLNNKLVAQSKIIKQ